MSFLHAVQRTLEGRSGTTAAGSTADEKQQQGEATGDVLQTGPNGPDFRRGLTLRGLLNRLILSSNAYRVKDHFWRWRKRCSRRLGSAEDQINPDAAAVGEPDFGI